MKRNYDEFLELVKRKRKSVNGKSKRIYSLARDAKFGFGVFFMEGYGTKQAIIKSTGDIRKHWSDGSKITSCAALDSTFYIVMTKHTKEYHENSRRGLLEEPGEKLKMQYGRDTEKEKLSLEYVMPVG